MVYPQGNHLFYPQLRFQPLAISQQQAGELRVEHLAHQLLEFVVDAVG